jgi:enoyl-CoA hydratase/carnithine racemase
MPSFESDVVSIEQRGSIAIVRFDRGDRKNALSLHLQRELTRAARFFEQDAKTAAVILTGRGEVFSLGADLTDPESAAARTAPLSERRVTYQTGGRMCRAWEEVAPLTIAAIEGWCVGGGAALAVACDLRIAAKTSTLYVPEIERGMNLSWGAVPRITHLVGPARAKRIVVLSEKIQAEQALQWGLVDELAEPGQVLQKALAWAQQAASLPPVPVRMIKQAVNASAFALDRATSQADFDQFALAVSAGDFEEGVRAFLEKRPARYTGA